MGIGSIFVYSHDSLMVGEDGPTHQPVEHLASLRAIPRLHLWRPCDLSETAVAWHEALKALDHPSALIVTRQTVHVPNPAPEAAELIARGAYVRQSEERDGQAKPSLVVLASGSEVELAARAVLQLPEGLRVGIRLVSMPCVEAFLQQPEDYISATVPADVPVVAVEMAAPSFIPGVRIDHWVGLEGFGLSGKGEEVARHFGFSADQLAQKLTGFLRH